LSTVKQNETMHRVRGALAARSPAKLVAGGQWPLLISVHYAGRGAPDETGLDSRYCRVSTAGAHVPCGTPLPVLPAREPHIFQASNPVAADPQHLMSHGTKTNKYFSADDAAAVVFVHHVYSYISAEVGRCL
jgi:hypothetical protein